MTPAEREVLEAAAEFAAWRTGPLNMEVHFPAVRRLLDAVAAYQRPRYEALSNTVRLYKDGTVYGGIIICNGIPGGPYGNDLAAAVADALNAAERAKDAPRTPTLTLCESDIMEASRAGTARPFFK